MRVFNSIQFWLEKLNSLSWIVRFRTMRIPSLLSEPLWSDDCKQEINRILNANRPLRGSAVLTVLGCITPARSGSYIGIVGYLPNRRGISSFLQPGLSLLTTPLFIMEWIGGDRISTRSHRATANCIKIITKRPFILLWWANCDSGCSQIQLQSIGPVPICATGICDTHYHWSDPSRKRSMWMSTNTKPSLGGQKGRTDTRL